MKLTIKHPRWGVLRDYRFPAALESRLTYELVIASPPEKVQEKPYPEVLKRPFRGLKNTSLDCSLCPVSGGKLRGGKPAYFLLATLGLHEGEVANGLRFGIMKRHGGWLHVQSNFRFLWTSGKCNKAGELFSGEPTPYYTDWPSHSSLFGIIDLAGLPKDRYYLYRSHWNKEQETLHILPHWNWEGREGEITPVFVYTNYPSAELFINGKSQGKRTKDLSVTIDNSADSVSIMNLKRQSRYRLMWMDTKYEPGTVKVVAYDADGKAVAEKELHTAGKPDHIELVADRNVIKADGKDLSFVTVRVVDKDGNLCPDASHEISFKVKGEGSYRAGANGNAASLESFQRPKMKVFSGMMTAIVSSTEQPGKITLEATGKGLKKGTLIIESRQEAKK